MFKQRWNDDEKYEDMEKGRKEAKIGLESEEDIVIRINTDDMFRNSLRACLITFGFALSSKRIVARKNNVKTDIIININGEIGVSVKSSTQTSFHNLDRRRLENWKDLLKMPDDVFEILKKAILRVAENPRNKFILEVDRRRIQEFFATRLDTIIEEIFRKGEQSLKLLLINDKRKREIYVFRMDDVIRFLYEDVRNNITFTDKGIIKLGRFLTVQRKGGNGRHVTIPKTHWEHPGNQLQFKFSPLKFAEYIAQTNAIRFCRIKY